MRTFAMMILGCKVNDYEATVLKNRLLEHGYREVSFKEKADIYVIFTCCVTNTAESKTRKMVHRARNTNPDALVVAVGCLVQIKGDSYDFDCADLIVGSKDKDKLFDLIDNNVKSKIVSPLTNEFKQMELETYPGKSRAFRMVVTNFVLIVLFLMLEVERLVVIMKRLLSRQSNYLRLLRN